MKHALEATVRNRDFAFLAFKLFAAWIMFTGLTQALEMALNWQSVVGEFASKNYAGGPSPALLTASAIGALLARAGLGWILWSVSGRLARRVFPADEPSYSMAERDALFRAAAFLMGLWLLGEALPTAAYWLVYAIRAGWRPRDPESVGRVASLSVKLGLGFALIRGGDRLLGFLTPHAPADPPASDEQA